MYAHVKDGSVDYMGTLPKKWGNVSGLHLSDGDDAYLKTLGWLPLVETNVTPTYNQTFDTDVIKHLKESIAFWKPYTSF